MRIPTFRLLRYTFAYLLGAFLIGWGLWCFGYELLYPAQVARESEAANGALVVYAPNMFSGVIICWGVILFLTPRFGYLSGTLILFGSMMAGFAMIFLAYQLGDGWIGVDTFRRYFLSTVMLSLLFLLGSCSIVVGLILCRRKPRAASQQAVLA